MIFRQDIPVPRTPASKSGSRIGEIEIEGLSVPFIESQTYSVNDPLFTLTGGPVVSRY